MQNPHDSILDIAIRAALEAARAITQVYNGHFDTETKADGSPITLADKRANDIICRHLSGSSWPIISEENKPADYSERKKWEHFWLVDPLDGTKEFIGRNGEFTVNIALVRDDEPVLGVIVAPALQTAWFGSVDMQPHIIHNTNALTNSSDEDFPAMLNKHAVQLPSPDNPDIKRIAVSRSHLDDKTKALLSKMSDHYQSIEIHPKGSSLKLCDLAAGDATFYPRFTPCYEWDTAAGHALLRAAGGEIFSLETQKPLCYNKRDLHNPPFIAFANRQDASSFFSQLTL